MISNTEIYGLEQSIKASGYPKSINIKETKLSYERATKLANCKNSTGHDCFLKGIIVQTDITAPLYWWSHFQRYHFADIISSQSKMHCIHKFDLDKMCNEFVDLRILEICKDYVKKFNEDNCIENFMKVISNIPSGFKLAARITTNYLQLKTIYLQRKKHKLPEWHLICSWICNLPYSEFITGPIINLNK